MICRQCRTNLLSRLSFSPVTSSSSNITARLPRHHTQTKSLLAALPARTRLYSSTATDDASGNTPSGSASSSSTSSAGHVASSVPGGTELKGLNYMKNKTDPIAMDDSEYPDWLWKLLDNSKKGKNAPGAVDISALNKKARARYEKKMAAIAALQPRVIPLHEQAKDITPASYNNANKSVPESDLEAATANVSARSDITKSARTARRKSIKEANYLRGL